MNTATKHRLDGPTTKGRSSKRVGVVLKKTMGKPGERIIGGLLMTIKDLYFIGRGN